MRKELAILLVLLAGMLAICSVAYCEDVSLVAGGKTFTCSADATEIDLGDVSIPDTNEAYSALTDFLLRLPNVTKVDMFSTDIRQARLETLARRYTDRKALFGIGPINEPANQNIMSLNAFLFGKQYPERVEHSEPVPDSFLEQFYLEVYRRIKPLLPADAVIVLSDQFDLSHWEQFMPADKYPGVWFDAHKYLTFSEGMFAYDGLPSAYAYRAKADQIQGGLILQNYLRLIRDVFAAEVLRAAKFHPVLVGEWCLVQNMEDIKKAKSAEEVRALYRQLADAHLEIWEQAEGGAYWSYRVDDPELPDAWDFRKCVKNGWLCYKDS